MSKEVHDEIKVNSELILLSKDVKPDEWDTLGKCHFLPGGGGLLKIGGDQVFFLRSKGGIKRFFSNKKGGITYIF